MSVVNEVTSTHKLSVFEISKWVNDFIKLEYEFENKKKEENVANALELPLIASDLGFGRCKLCGGVTFDNRESQVNHYKSELHLVNLKRTLQGLEAIVNTEVSPDTNDVELFEDSSNENSEEETEVEEVNMDNIKATDNTIVESYIEGQIMKIYNNVHGTIIAYIPEKYAQCRMKFHQILLQHQLSPLSNSNVNMTPWNQLSVLINHIKDNIYNEEKNYWAVILLQSGKFAAAIFDIRDCANQMNTIKQQKVIQDVQNIYFKNSNNNTTNNSSNSSNNNNVKGASYVKLYNLTDIKAVHHKVIKRYTVRAKAGGSQTSYDNKGN